MTEGAIFDLDGIVVDTVPIHFAAWKKMFSEYGKNFTFEDYKEKVDGIPRIDGAAAVLTELKEKELQEAANLKQKYFRSELDSAKIPVYDSTVKLIRDLKNRGLPVGVISSSKNCTHILKNIGIYDLLDTVVDGSRGLKGKPDPEIFLVAAKELGVSPEKCVVFEDAALGVESAKKAGMYVVGVDRYSNPSRLSSSDKIINDAEELTASEVAGLI